MVLQPEYDVVHEIPETPHRFPFPLAWEHAEDHQDARTQWYKLTWMETLNIHTDKHATSRLADHHNPDKRIHMIPSSKIALQIDTTDITSHYGYTSHKSRNSPGHPQAVAPPLWMESVTIRQG